MRLRASPRGCYSESLERRRSDGGNAMNGVPAQCRLSAAVMLELDEVRFSCVSVAKFASS